MDNQQKYIAICSPSRGLTFTEHEEYIENVRDTYPALRVFRTHNLPIPDCFNTLAQQVLSHPLRFSYMWWIEDDVVPEEKTLDRFLEAVKEYDVIAQNYGFNNGWGTIGRSQKDNKILFTGFGCTFMKREVLEAFQEPIFKADKSFNIGSLRWYDNGDPAAIYGQFDIRFGSEARAKGFKFGQISGECRHLKLISLGRPETNVGTHVIGEKGRVEKELLLPIADL